MNAPIGAARGSGPSATGWWVAAALYALVIFWLSSQSHPLGAGRWPPFADKLAHAGLYGGLSALLFGALRRSWCSWSVRRVSAVAVGLAVVYGLTDEWHQAFVPFRSAEGGDLAADAIGACLAQWVIQVRRVRRWSPPVAERPLSQ